VRTLFYMVIVIDP